MIRRVRWQLTGACCGGHAKRGSAGRASVGSYRSARRQTRAYEFGRRHPRLTVVIVGVALAGVIAVCAFQIRHGAYLGRGWAIAASAGMATAAVLGAAALSNSKRHSPA
jgi:hypothetical protein